MKTIGTWGCLLVAYNNQARYLRLCEDTPPQFLGRMRATGAMSGPYLLPGALATAFPGSVRYDGYMIRSDAMRGKIRQYVDRLLPVPARVDFNPATGQWEQHWVLIIGYNADDWLIADPWHGDVVLASQRYNITGDDVLEALFYEPV